jgi:protein phosphatase
VCDGGDIYMGAKETYIKKFLVGGLSDVGNIRNINEDYIGYHEDGNLRLYIVADGMGGHNAGDIASKTAVESCIKYIQSLRDVCDYEVEFKKAITYANDIIYEKSLCNNSLNGMGTTITACLIHNNEVFIANVGDSSCYVIMNNEIKKITKDHSLVQELVDDGSITEEEALRHPNKNIITRALGTNKNIEIDVFKIKLSSVEKFILCTDGLTNEVSKEEMYDIITNNNDDIASNLLIELAKNKGGRDNISVIVFGGEQI